MVSEESSGRQKPTHLGGAVSAASVVFLARCTFAGAGDPPSQPLPNEASVRGHI